MAEVILKDDLPVKCYRVVGLLPDDGTEDVDWLLRRLSGVVVAGVAAFAALIMVGGGEARFLAVDVL